MAQNDEVTLYFIPDAEPSAADVARAAKIPGIVRFRNADEIGTDFEESDFVTASNGLDIPAAYDAVDRRSPERPVSLSIVPNAPSIDLSDAEPLRLVAMAHYMDETDVDVTNLCDWDSATPGTATVGDTADTDKGHVAPVGAGTTVVTASLPFAAPGEPGVEYAAQTGTFGGVPVADTTVTIDEEVYTWKAAPTTVAKEVKIGATPEESCANLVAAVNGWNGAGSLYGSLTTPHPTVVAEADGADIIVEAIAPGTAGNAIATTESGSSLTWVGATLAGGADATETIDDTVTVTVVA